MEDKFEGINPFIGTVVYLMAAWGCLWTIFRVIESGDPSVFLYAFFGFVWFALQMKMYMYTGEILKEIKTIRLKCTQSTHPTQ